MQAVIVQRCTTLPDGLGLLVQSGSDEGFMFMPRLMREWHSGENRFEAPGEALLCVRVDAKLAGICGLNIDRYTGDTRTGRVRHLYVSPEHRGRGLGTMLVSDIIALARVHFSWLRLRTPQAGRFYERLGFERCDDLEATHIMKLGS